MEFKFIKFWVQSRLYFIRDYMIGFIKFFFKICIYIDVYVYYFFKYLVIFMLKYNKYNVFNKFKYYNMIFILGIVQNNLYMYCKYFNLIYMFDFFCI